MSAVAMVMRTNVHTKSIQKEFLSKLTEYLSKTFSIETKNVTLELHLEAQMMRAGSTAPMMNIDLHHNSNRASQEHKPELATDIAKFISAQIRIPEDRILVLFFDTRKCT
ncbi:uncharacterized protein LOC124132654 [Haliotis rufescens]|uniref:uncharacterized protein LOC124132654 n=1 Tax=Haliotis rufescens TaxID=6454 RepID=UPI001EAFFF28|nr:uncharacterized protein LOC124132654 [Haliotis rufescens]XP_046352619.1 uncharacterized protein LOC124132654 [Haliotis rufescens]